MKILAISYSSGRYLPDISERLFSELTHYAEVDVLSDVGDVSLYKTQGARNLYNLPLSSKQSKWNRRFLRWFGVLPLSERWSREAYRMVARDYDMVLAYVSGAQLLPAVCGRYIARQLGCKFAIYTVDAIPPPGGWCKPNIFRQKLKLVRRYFPAADYVAASNSHMLAYQLSTFTHKQGMMSNVLYTPSPSHLYEYPISKENVLLFTGSMYGLRNPRYLFTAFKRLLGDYPDATLIFVGVKMELDAMRQILTPEECSHIDILPHTDDLSPLFSRAKVLIDIDADLEKDPFLSSKIVTYIKVNRMIVCETGEVTPSREMFAGMKTIVQCNHSADSLYEGLSKAMKMADSEQDYSERREHIKQFSAEQVCSVLWDDIIKMLPHKKSQQ